MMGHFSCFCCRLLTFFSKKQLFEKFLSGTLSECQRVWIQIKTDVLSVPNLGPNCLLRLSADVKGRRYIKEKVNENFHQPTSNFVDNC